MKSTGWFAPSLVMLVFALAVPQSAAPPRAPSPGGWQLVQEAIKSLPPFSSPGFEAAVKKILAELEQWLKAHAIPLHQSRTGDRWVVVLRHTGMGGTFASKQAEQPDRCPGVPVGYESLVGVVERRAVAEHWPEGVEYTGTLGRQTSTGLCEVRDTPDGEKWCGGLINGSGPVEVTIALPADTERDAIEIVIRPVAAETQVLVEGKCSSLDNAAVAQQYREEDTLMFDLPDERGTTVKPTLHQALRHQHIYTQERGAAPWSESQYTMWVSRIGAPSPRPRP